MNVSCTTGFAGRQAAAAKRVHGAEGEGALRGTPQLGATHGVLVLLLLRHTVHRGWYGYPTGRCWAAGRAAAAVVVVRHPTVGREARTALRSGASQWRW